MKKYVLKVDGMMCGMCEAHVNNAVRKCANVNDVKSSHTSGTTEILCEDSIDIAAIKAAIEQDGYSVTSVTEKSQKSKAYLQSYLKNNQPKSHKL